MRKITGKNIQLLASQIGQKVRPKKHNLLNAPRKELNLQEGDDLIISLSDKKTIEIQSAKQALIELQEMTKNNKKSLSGELIKIRREEAKNE